MSNTNQSSEEKSRIIVDEDWKSQVEREKEVLRDQASSTDTKRADSETEYPLPPANLAGMVSMFASQAMAALGLLPDPMTGEASTNRPLAKFLIDSLGVLEQKTEGNRTDEENNVLRDALHHLRMIYVATPARQSQASPPKKPSIELP
jgi:hypothetical protein